MRSASASLLISVLAVMPTRSMPFVPIDNSLHQCSKSGSNSKKKVLKKNTDLSLYRSAAEAISEAERICMVEGAHSQRCKVAWDIVEELEAADAHHRTQTTGPNELSYVPLAQGLEILSVKIERKLEELRKLSTEMAEAGAGPEVERLVYASDEMAQIIEEARQAMAQYR
mmetsp:Transcript_25414/g.43391  ORF Transcript_25414/g.43391 Transcript_25414/m.43391 type:complete len:170 (+) Transcript_25414:89-598(+)